MNLRDKFFIGIAIAALIILSFFSYFWTVNNSNKQLLDCIAQADKEYEQFNIIALNKAVTNQPFKQADFDFAQNKNRNAKEFCAKLYK